MKRKNEKTLLFFVIFFSYLGQFFAELNQTQSVVEEINVGMIFDVDSWEGKMMQSCISMAISDFYGEHRHSYFKTRVVLHARDSKGQPLSALSSALDLLENFEVSAIIGGQTAMEANLLAEVGDKVKVPVISFSAPITSPSSNKHPYFVQITQDETSQATAMAAVVGKFKWRDVIIIYENNYAWKDFIPNLVDSLQKINIHVANKSSLATSSEDNLITEELCKLMELQQMVFIVHMSPVLALRLFMNAKKLGMMRKGYAWIMTVSTMNHLHSVGSSMADSMQGVVGLKYYIPASKELHNFTARWRKNFLLETDREIMELSPFCIWAYDVAWALAKAAESAWPMIALTRKTQRRLKRMDLDNIISTSGDDLILLGLKEILLRNKFKGISGEFQFRNGKLVPNAFEIVNMIGSGERRVGFWTSDGKVTGELYSSNHGRRLSSTSNELEDIIWPGGSATIPKGFENKMSGIKLRIVVPRNDGFPEFVNITLQHNASGFCIDVFKAAIEELPYHVDYEFIPFLNGSGQDNGSYTELIDQIYLEQYDAAVGDITITSNRSLYVDFTLPYTDMGVGMVAPNSKNNMWIFLKPLRGDLWLSSAAFFIFTGFVIWLIERPINNEFQGPTSQQIGMIFWFSFSTLVFAHRERLLSNFSKFVVIVWVFVVLILTSSYTATLTSMITVRQINMQMLNSKNNYIGYQRGSEGVISNLNFQNSNLQPFVSPEQYAYALSKGSKKGGVSAIVDEIPYIKVFLARYSADFSLIEPTDTSTNGFALVFRKGMYTSLVNDLSRIIAKLREDGELQRIEDRWFKGQSMISSEDTSNDVKPLTLDSFRGLFLITGVSSTLALAMLYGFVLYKNWHALRSCDLIEFIRLRLKFVNEYLFTKVFGRVPSETNVIHPE